jgi:hypothetical protein
MKAQINLISSAQCLTIVLIACFQQHAFAINKCQINGSVAYQSEPCPDKQETVAQGIERRKYNESLHAKLDQMLLKGIGVVTRISQPTQSSRVSKEADASEAKDEYFKAEPRSRALREAKNRNLSEQAHAKALQTNAESSARLTSLIEDSEKACAGKLKQYPLVGMKDEVFRNCTIFGRFGGIDQVVAGKQGNIELRLYVSNNSSAVQQRIYSVDGVITAIKP